MRELAAYSNLAIGVACVAASATLLLLARRMKSRDRGDAQLAARDANARLAHFFESAGWGLALLKPEDGTLQSVNPAFARMHGFAPAELIGRPFSSLVDPGPTKPLGRHPTGIREVDHQVYERVHIRKDGSRFPVRIEETLLRGQPGREATQANPASAEAGAVWLHTASVLDISERKRAEEERTRLLERERDAARVAQAERARLTAILKQMPSGVVIMEVPSGKVIINDRIPLIFGRPIQPAENVSEYGDYAPIFVEERYKDPKNWPMVRAMKGEVIIKEEMTILRADGKHAIVSVNGAPVHDSEGNVIAAITTVDDITERKSVEAERAALLARERKAREALTRSNQELDQFAYVASHDLKAPLRGIANLSQWIEEDLMDRMTPDSREQMRLLRGRVQRMESLIEGILDYSRAGRVRHKTERVDVGALLGEIVELIAPPAGVTVRVAQGMPVLSTERIPLQQIFLNLINNAIKHGNREGARVEVTCRDAGAFHDFAITDNGKGIAPEYHDRIWGMFQTLETRDKIEGTGIGLSIVKKLAESHGGRAWVESTLGAGATFHFLWPKQDVAET